MAFVIDVFLSSTAEDLREYSNAVYERLRPIEVFRCTHQRDFGARDQTAVEYCRERVQKAELFVGIIGMRRGWEPKGDGTKRSITEMEHDWAKEAGKRRFLYVTPENFPVPGHLHETKAEHNRQRAFRKTVMASGERIVSQKGFETSSLLASSIVEQLLLHVATSNLITQLRPELAAQSPASPDEQRPAIAAAVERLAEDHDIDLLALAENPEKTDVAELERKLTDRAKAQEAEGRSALKTSAEYWRHIGALAFPNNTRKSLAAYEKAVELDPSEPEAWRYLGELQLRLGNLDAAEQSFDRVLALGKSSSDLKTQTTGSVRLSWIAMDRNNLAKAKKLITDAIRFAESANWLEGMARAYGSLGNLHHLKRELGPAEAMYRKAVAINEELGHKIGMANIYVNIGTIHEIRHELIKAEEIHHKALNLYAEAGNKEGEAHAYGSLGTVHWARVELEQAEQMQRKSLALYEELDSKKGIAHACINLACTLWAAGQLEEAEKMYRRGLSICLALDDKGGIATAYFNLGIIHQHRKEKAAMCECWHKARDLYREMGLKEDIAETEQRLKANKCGSPKGAHAKGKQRRKA